jgi:hypothetical protein
MPIKINQSFKIGTTLRAVSAVNPPLRQLIADLYPTEDSEQMD